MFTGVESMKNLILKILSFLNYINKGHNLPPNNP